MLSVVSTARCVQSLSSGSSQSRRRRKSTRIPQNKCNTNEYTNSVMSEELTQDLTQCSVMSDELTQCSTGLDSVDLFINACCLDSSTSAPGLQLDITSVLFIIETSSVCVSTLCSSTVCSSNRKRRRGSKERNARKRRKATEGTMLKDLFSHISTPSRNRVKNYRLFDYFPKNIVNMSNTGFHNLTLPEFGLCDKPRVLSPIERIVLSLGPQFIMSPKYLSTDEITDLFSIFARSVRLKYYFKSNAAYNGTYTALDKLIKLPSSFMPNTASVHVESYLHYVRNSLLSMRVHKANKGRKHKLSSYIYFKCRQTALCIVRTIMRLRKDTSIVVKKSDKNLGLCILPSVLYEQQAMLHLNDTSTYCNLTVLPKMSVVFDTLREYVKGHPVSKRLLDYLFHKESTCINPDNCNVSLAYFYMLPKIHKTPISTRPIVASIKSVTYNASKYVDEKFLPGPKFPGGFN